MKITTVKGTNDYLPEEVRLRDYLQNQILNTYQDAGFERIMTPAVEDIENLDKSDGGDNLNLIFKILKRGDKLKKAMDSGDTNKLCDMGLGDNITIDLGLVNRSNYYTGVIFRGYAEGSGLTIVSGGRYDNLLGEFGLDAPAIGFGVNVNALCDVMREEINVDRPIRIALTGQMHGPDLAGLVEVLGYERAAKRIERTLA